MDNTQNVTNTILDTINKIFENIFSSIDNNIYSVLDDLVFVTSDILDDKNMEVIFGTSTSSGILLIANALLISFIIFYSIKYLCSNFTYEQVETPWQFLFKIILCGIFMNSSYFIVDRYIDLMSNISLTIRELGKELFGKNVDFSNLISTMNKSLSLDLNSINIFSLDGLIKGTLTISILSLAFSYSLRYIMIKVFILISPFAILALSQKSTSWFFKAWARNFFSIMFIQIIVALILVILFSMDGLPDNLLNKFLYIGGIYALIRVNSFVKEFVGGISTDVKANVGNYLKFIK